MLRRATPKTVSLLASPLLALLLGPAACKPSDSPTADESSTQTDSGKSDDSTSKSEPAPAMPSFGMPPFAAMFTSGLEKPGPYEELKQSKTFSDTAPHYLVFELDAPVVELETVSFLGGTQAVPLRTLTQRVHEAANNDHVSGLVLRVADVALDMATAQELRETLLAFKGDGKRKLVCHTEGVGSSAYYVLTACDRITLAPLGGLMINGPAATPVHVKGLLDRLGIKADFLHVGAFKGAAEPLTRDKPTPEMLETLEAVVEQSYQTLLEGITEGRRIDRDAAIAAVDQALFVGDEAVQAKLVDDVASWDDFRDSATEGTPWKVVSDEANPFKDFGKLQRFLGLMPPDRPSEPHVALVYAVGNIIDGKGGGIMGAREQIASRPLVAALRAVAADDNVKAVVLRVDSGGGSALASEQIWLAASQLAEKKPLIVSMGSVAASGGYYISAPAKKIYARHNTLTGSIGVVGGKLVFGDALEKIGVKTYAVKRGKRAMIGSTVNMWTPDERQAMLHMMEATYERFLERVGKGRSLQRDEVHALAQGRVWTGADAKSRGLVDELGGLEAALADAHTMAGLQPGGKLEVYPPEPTLRDILVSSLGDVQAPTTQGALEQLLLAATGALGGAEGQAVQRMLATIVDLKDARVWALSFVEPPRQ